jgi:hypothetical protein
LRLLCKLYDPIAVFGISDNNSFMELLHLRYFSPVAQYLNYSEASRRLRAASDSLQRVEDEGDYRESFSKGALGSGPFRPAQLFLDSRSR